MIKIPPLNYTRPFQVRDIPLKTSSYRGQLVTTKLSLRNEIPSLMFSYESGLERDAYILLDHDQHCYDFQPQPVIVPWIDKDGKDRKACPDCWAIFINAKQFLFEVKSYNKLQELKDDENWQLKIAAINGYCKERGWEFKIIDERLIITPRLTNVTIFRGVAQQPPKTLLVEQIKDVLPHIYRRGTGITFPNLVKRVRETIKIPDASIEYVLKYLLYYQFLYFEWNLPFTKKTLIFLNSNFESLAEPFYEIQPIIQENTLAAESINMDVDSQDLPLELRRIADKRLEAIESLIKNPNHTKNDIIRIAKKIGYLFTWDEIPGNDNSRLIEYLTKNFDVDWVKTARIEKSEDGKKINILEGERMLSLELDNKKNKVKLIIDNCGSHKSIATIDNGKLYEIGKGYLKLYRDIKAYRREGWRGLFPKHFKKGNYGSHFDDELEQILQDAVDRYEHGQSSMDSYWKEEVEKKCKVMGYPAPSYKSYRLRVHDREAKERKGKQGGSVRHEISQSVMGDLPTGVLPLYLIQMDHSELDIELVDSVYRRPVGRPYLTLAIDTYSRMIYGYFLSFHPPRRLSVTRTLYTGILPKEDLLKRLGYLFSWEGVPGNDSERLIDYLKKNFGIDWVESAKIEKIDSGSTIKVSAGKKSLSLKLNEQKTKVNLKVDSRRTCELVVRSENDRLRIYDFGVDMIWPIHGLPKRVQIDNSMEFRSSDFDQFCRSYNIDYEFRPLRRPDKGSYIERMFGTINRRIRDGHLRGYAPPLKDRPPNYDPVKEAEKGGMTLAEFEKWLLTYLLKDYHLDEHGGLE